MKRTVYIGTETGQELAAEVLQCTIERRAVRPVKIMFLNRELAAGGVQLDNAIASNTPFSKQRLFVPMLAGSGQAAYLDSDMLVFRDINELFDLAGETPISSCATRQRDREPQTSVTIFNVAQCTWRPLDIMAQIDADPAKYRPYLYEYLFAGGTARVLPAPWNDLEEFDAPTTCLLHFTDMDTQPWLTSTNRQGDLWLDCLRESTAMKPELRELVRESVARFDARPSLWWQVNNGWQRAARIPFAIRLLDIFGYVPPHALANGLPFGIGRAISKFMQSRAPRVLKYPLMFAASVVLLARRRRRLLVKATLVNRKCIINRNTEALVW